MRAGDREKHKIDRLLYNFLIPYFPYFRPGVKGVQKRKCIFLYFYLRKWYFSPQKIGHQNLIFLPRGIRIIWFLLFFFYWTNYGHRFHYRKINQNDIVTVEPAMSSHSYEQPTSYERPLGHSQKWHFLYKWTSYEQPPALKGHFSCVTRVAAHSRFNCISFWCENYISEKH